MAARALLVIMLVVCGACDSPSEPSPPPPPPPPPPNTAPVIQAVGTSVEARTEVDKDVAVTVTVTDAETAVDALGYIWTATTGIISGTGRNVTWRLPKGIAMTPQNVTISVIVTESYQTLQGGVLVNGQHRVEGSAAPFRVHDSAAEVEALSLAFLRDFADNTKTPAECVTNFSDTCPGKAREIADIERVRRGRYITSSSLAFRSVAFNSALTQGDAVVDCLFASTVTQKLDANDPFNPGDKVVADGDCALRAIYEAGVWKLCESSFSGSEVGQQRLDRGLPRRSVASALFGYAR